jgi:hypothetical protein
MKCKRCGWLTSPWQRDLWSGLCAACRKVDETSPGYASWMNPIRIPKRVVAGTMAPGPTGRRQA